MKNYFVLFSVAVLMASGTLFAAEEKPAHAADGKDKQEWMKYTQPGEGHKVLANMAGKWAYTSKMWMTADAKPEESKGTSNAKLIFGGRFVQQDFKGKVHGKPFEGIGLFGYDNVKQEYQSVWIDSFSTGMALGTGTFDSTNNTLKETIASSCPMTGDKNREMRSEIKWTDKKNFTYEMYAKSAEGSEYKTLEITYKKL